MKQCLLIAAVYNVVFGVWAIFLPSSAFDLVGMARPNYPELWQCIGMIVGVYGLGYAIAAFDPLRHWPIVLVGFLGKIFGPIGFVQALVKGSLPLIVRRHPAHQRSRLVASIRRDSRSGVWRQRNSDIESQRAPLVSKPLNLGSQNELKRQFERQTFDRMLRRDFDSVRHAHAQRNAARACDGNSLRSGP